MPKDLLVEQHHKLQFEANIQLATQRFGSKLRKYVTEVSCSATTGMRPCQNGRGSSTCRRTAQINLATVALFKLA